MTYGPDSGTRTLGSHHCFENSVTFAAPRNKPFSLDHQAASEQLQTLRDLAEHARSIVRSTKGRTINLIATRAIDAGTLVSNADVTIRPGKKAPMPAAAAGD